MLTPTKEAGVFVLASTGKPIRLTEWEEQDVWDTQVLPDVLDLENITVPYFSGNQGNGALKTARDTNVTKPNQLTSYNELIVLRPFILANIAWGATPAALNDQQAVYGEGMIQFNKNSRPIITNSHCYRFSSGYGLVAYGLDPTGTLSPGGSGVAGTAAQSPLLVPWQLIDKDQFDAQLTFPGSNAGISLGGVAAPDYAAYQTTDALSIMVGLHGFVKRPATS